jgi:hypothetical protein
MAHAAAGPPGPVYSSKGSEAGTEVALPSNIAGTCSHAQIKKAKLARVDNLSRGTVLRTSSAQNARMYVRPLVRPVHNSSQSTTCDSTAGCTGGPHCNTLMMTASCHHECVRTLVWNDICTVSQLRWAKAAQPAEHEPQASGSLVRCQGGGQHKGVGHLLPRQALPTCAQQTAHCMHPQKTQ